MSAAWAQSEAERVQANMIRIGVVAEVDPATARAKIRMGGLVTDWLPWGVARAGGTRTASAPTVGEQRIVFSPYGDTGQAIIGQAIYQDAHGAPTASGTQDVVDYPDGSRVEYDSATSTLTVTVAGAGNVIVNCQQATVNATTSVTLDTPDTFCTGNLTVAKSLTMGEEGGSATMKGAVAITGPSVTHNGKSIGDTHAHSGVQPGGGNTAAPV